MHLSPKEHGKFIYVNCFLKSQAIRVRIISKRDDGSVSFSVEKYDPKAGIIAKINHRDVIQVFKATTSFDDAYELGVSLFKTKPEFSHV